MEGNIYTLHAVKYKVHILYSINIHCVSACIHQARIYRKHQITLIQTHRCLKQRNRRWILTSDVQQGRMEKESTKASGIIFILSEPRWTAAHEAWHCPFQEYGN